MDPITDLEATTVKCFKGDLPRIKRLGERLEARNPTGGAIFNQHTISHAINALEEKLDREAA